MRMMSPNPAHDEDFSYPAALCFRIPDGGLRPLWPLPVTFVSTGAAFCVRRFSPESADLAALERSSLLCCGIRRNSIVAEAEQARSCIRRPVSNRRHAGRFDSRSAEALLTSLPRPADAGIEPGNPFLENAHASLGKRCRPPGRSEGDVLTVLPTVAF